MMVGITKLAVLGMGLATHGGERIVYFAFRTSSISFQAIPVPPRSY